MNSFFKFIADSFRYLPKERYKFGITDNETQNNSNDIVPLENLNQNIFPSISVNLDYIKVKFNTSLCSASTASSLKFTTLLLKPLGIDSGSLRKILNSPSLKLYTIGFFSGTVTFKEYVFLVPFSAVTSILN